MSVISERALERNLRVRAAFTPRYCHYIVYFSLLEKTETRITIFETQFSTDCPYAENGVTYLKWDILTPDPRSHRVIHRQTYKIHWFDQPLVWRGIEGIAVDGIEDFN